nr:11567_t:CDS:2 [Entrophospora candida]
MPSQSHNYHNHRELPPLSIPSPHTTYPSPSIRSQSTSPSMAIPQSQSYDHRYLPSQHHHDNRNPLSTSPSQYTRSLSPSHSPSIPQSTSPSAAIPPQSQFQPKRTYDRQNSHPYTQQHNQEQYSPQPNQFHSPPPQGQSILPMGFPFTKSSKVNPGDSYSPIDSSPTAIHQHQKKKSTIYEDEYNPMSPRSEKGLLNIEDEDEKQKGKYGGLMKYICCGSTKKSKCKICAIICCVLILIIIGVVAAVVIFGKKPQVEFLELGPSPNNVEAYVKTPTGFDFNVGLKIRVNNPNIIGATFSFINVDAFYPNFDKSIGGGNLTNVNIESRGNTTINFPFSIHYDKEIDPNFAILLDIASKCGLIGSSGKQKITINYTVSLSLKVLISFPPYSVKRQVNIDCPLQIPNIPGFDPLKAASDLNPKKKKK